MKHSLLAKCKNQRKTNFISQKNKKVFISKSERRVKKKERLIRESLRLRVEREKESLFTRDLKRDQNPKSKPLLHASLKDINISLKFQHHKSKSFSLFFFFIIIHSLFLLRFFLHIERKAIFFSVTLLLHWSVSVYFLLFFLFV